MKKILVSMMTIALVSALIGGGVYAAFSDTESSTDNTFTAGTLDLEVDSENPWASTVLTVGPMVPGATATTVDIDLENLGNIDGDLFMKLIVTGTTTGVADYPTGVNEATSEPEYLAEGATWDPVTKTWDNSGWVAVNDVDSQIDVVANYGGTAITGIDGVKLDSVPAGWTAVTDLAASGTLTVTLGGSLVLAADNKYQGDVATVTVEFYLAQDGQTP